MYKKECLIDNILLTHEPKGVPENIFNYYGHIHDKEEDEKYKDGRHRCVSLEKTNYMPLEIEIPDKKECDIK